MTSGSSAIATTTPVLWLLYHQTHHRTLGRASCTVTWKAPTVGATGGCEPGHQHGPARRVTVHQPVRGARCAIPDAERRALDGRPPDLTGSLARCGRTGTTYGARVFVSISIDRTDQRLGALMRSQMLMKPHPSLWRAPVGEGQFQSIPLTPTH